MKTGLNERKKSNGILKNYETIILIIGIIIFIILIALIIKNNYN